MVSSTVVPFFRSAAEQEPRPYLAGRDSGAVRPFAPPVHDAAHVAHVARVAQVAQAFGLSAEHDAVHTNDGGAGATHDDTLHHLGENTDDISLPEHAAIPAAGPTAVEELHGRIDEAIAQLAAVHAALLSRARVEVVDLALQVASHVTSQVVAREAFDLNPIVDDALRQLGDALSIVVRVGALHHASVATHAGGNSRVRVVLDPSLGDGDIVVDSDNGTVDARLQNRLDAVGRALRHSTMAAPPANPAPARGKV